MWVLFSKEKRNLPQVPCIPPDHCHANYWKQFLWCTAEGLHSYWRADPTMLGSTCQWVLCGTAEEIHPQLPLGHHLLVLKFSISMVSTTLASWWSLTSTASKIHLQSWEMGDAQMFSLFWVSQRWAHIFEVLCLGLRLWFMVSRGFDGDIWSKWYYTNFWRELAAISIVLRIIKKKR